MDPYSGRVYELGADLMKEGDVPQPGSFFPIDELKGRVADLERPASRDEIAAATEAQALVLVEQHVAQQLKLGAREQERRKRRRKATREARRVQRRG